MTVANPTTPNIKDSVTERQLTVAENRTIHVRVFDAKDPKSVVIIAGAMGVSQRSYEKFAHFLGEKGHCAITFDYFGTGRSLQTSIKDCQTDVRSWGEQDCEAIIDFAHTQYPDLPLQWIGHSVGGQLLGMIRNTDKLSNALTLSCGTGYWLHNSPETRRIVWLMWYVIAPLSIKFWGYFPGKKFKMVGDLPAKVMLQWRAWCLQKDYAVGVEGPEIRQRYADVSTPITSISFSDDEMLSERNINALHAFFNQDHVTMVRLSPQEIGEKFIGHLGWFREKFKQSIWTGEILPRLNRGV